jgi:hypothetical protein
MSGVAIAPVAAGRVTLRRPAVGLLSPEIHDSGERGTSQRTESHDQNFSE